MPWEQPLIEGPCLFRAASGYYLFYSAGRWKTDGYAVGFARGPSPRGPFTKVTTDRPWLASRQTAAGPGGQCVVDGADGATYLAYHAWDSNAIGYEAGGARKLHIERFTIAPDGPRLADDEA
jgi:beta-xylosidase